MKNTTTPNTNTEDVTDEILAEDGGTGRTNYNDRNKTLFRQRRQLQLELDELTATLDASERRNKFQIDRKRRRLDDKTRDIVDSNLGLVKKYVRLFTGNATREESQDFEAAGMLGLMKAIDNYDPDKGSFAQWAFKPIQREILRAVHASDHNNMTAGDFERRPSILKAKALLQDGDDSVRVSHEDVAAEAGVTVKQVKRVLEAPRLESIYSTVGDGETTVGDLIESEEIDLDEQVITDHAVADLQTLGLASLEPRELFVLTRRLGLDSEPEQRLSAIGDMLGLSREAVRQIESKAVAKLSHPVLLRRLARSGRD